MRLLANAVAAVIALSASAARADSRDAPAAEALFREGRAAMEANDFARACPKFAESLRLDFAAGTLLNLATCEEEIGRLARAWEHFAQLLEVLPTGDDRRPLAQRHLHDLDRRVPRLSVVPRSAIVAGLRVTRDDVELRVASFGVALPVDPGEHTIAVVAPGRAARVYRVSLAAGERRALAVEPGFPIDDVRSARRTPGLVIGGVGVAALGAGAYFGVRALSARATSDAGCTGGVCKDAASAQAYDDARSFAHVADASIAIGVVAVAVGTYLFVTSTPSKPAPTVAAGPNGVGVRW